MCIIYAGSPDYVVPPLETLVASGHEVCLVITPPDRPSGRGQSVEAPPLKTAAQDMSLDVYQPDSINSPAAVDRLSDEEPDFIVVASFGKILTRELLQVPSEAAINIHPSYLPRYRGPSPVAGAILDGNDTTGITIFQMDEKMDHGPILQQKRTGIKSDETTGELRRRLFEESSSLLLETIQQYKEGTVQPREQDHDQATYTSFLSKQDGRIHWKKTSNEIYQQLRALKPWPGVYSWLEMGRRDELLRVHIDWGTPVKEKDCSEDPGTIRDIEEDGVIVQTGDGGFKVERLKPENKSSMPAGDFVNGYQPKIGDRFRDNPRETA